MVSVTGGAGSSLAPGTDCDSCYDMARDAAGNFILAAGNQLTRYTSSGAPMPPITAPEGTFFFSVAVDNTRGGGNYIVADNSGDQLLSISPNPPYTAQIIAWFPGNGDTFVRVDSSGNYILATDNAYSYGPYALSMFRITPPATGSVTCTLQGGSSGCALIAISPANNTSAPLSTSGLAFDASGNYLNIDWYNDVIFTITPSGTSAPLFTDPNHYLVAPQGLYRDSLTGDIFLLDGENDALYTLSPNGNILARIASGTLFSAHPAAVITVDGAAPFEVTTSALPNGYISRSYGPVTMTATGGSGNYSWALSGAPPGITMTPAGIVSGIPMVAGSFTVSMTVTDTTTDSTASIIYLVTVFPAPSVTTATLPNGNVGSIYGPVVMTGTGGSGNYSWTVSGAPAGVTMTTAGVLRSSSALTTAGVFTITATLTDTTTAVTASHTYSVSVLPAQPVITTTSLPDGGSGSPYASVTMAASGGSGHFTWTASGAPTGLTMTAAGLLSGTPTASGSFTVVVTATDTIDNLTATHAYSITVFPALSITTASLPRGTAASAYGPVSLAASGGSGQYLWRVSGLPSGVTMTAAGVVSGSPTTSGVFPVTPTVTDTMTNVAASHTYQVTVALALSVAITSLPNGTAGLPWGPVTMAATGGSGNYSWTVSGAPTGLTMTTAGVLSGTPSVSGTFNVILTVTDTASSVSASRTFSVTVAQPLSVVTTSLPNGTAGSVYGPVTMAAAGGSGHYSWAVSGGPAGVTVTAAGVLTSNSALAAATAGSYPAVKAIVTDTTTNLTASQTYKVTIVSAPTGGGGPAQPSPLAATGPTNLGGFAPPGNISANYTATGGQSPYTWSAPQGLPAGLTLNASSGALTGAITQAGNYTFQIQVADSQATSATSTLNVRFFVLGIATTSLPSGSVNVAYSQTLSTIGGTASCTWSLTGGSLPAGLSLAATTGIISGTPLAPGTGAVPASGITSSFTVSAVCGGVTVSQPLSINVTSPSQSLSLSIPGGGGATPVTLTGGSINVPYSQNLQAVHGAPPYQWTLTSGAAPGELTLSASGVLAGTPTTSGSFVFNAQVRDSAGATAGATFAVYIAPLALTFLTRSPLSDGVASSDYPPQIMVVTGGTPPYTYTVSGALPPGLVFSNGMISGMPTRAGVSTFTVTAADSTQPTPRTTAAPLQISIAPAHADLVLAQTSLNLALNAGAGGQPTSASIPVESSVVSQLLNYTIGVTPAAPWLNVAGGGTTPGAIAVSLNSNAFAIAPGMSQTTSIIVTCAAPSPCAGNSQTISVVLNVSAAASPQLVTTANLLSFSAQTSGTQNLSQTLGLQNAGGGVITVNSVTPANAFLSVGSFPTAIPAGPPLPVTVNVNPAGLAPGYYQSSILVNTSAGSTTIAVTLLLSQIATLTLNPAGAQFSMPAGSAPGNPNGSFLVSTTGSSTVHWTAALLSGANWLSLATVSGASTSAAPGTVGFTINSNASSLSPQAYYATIQVTSGDVVDPKQNYLVILNVGQANSALQPDPEPAGLLFTAGGGPVAAQTVDVYVSSTSSLNYQASSDNPWLLVSPSTGWAFSGTPGVSSVSVNTSGLGPGVYRGNVNYAFSAAAVRTVSVTLIVEASGAVSSERPGGSQPKAVCSPTQLVPTETGLPSNFSVLTSQPTPLTVLLVDNCGRPVTNGQVVATFSNGDSSLTLNPENATSGIYSGTWTPRNGAAQITITALATASNLAAASVQIAGQVTPSATPLLAQNGTVNAFAAAFVPGTPVAPGTIVAIYGSGLAANVVAASTIPLPTSLSQTSVSIGGLPAPIYYVSPGQINAQVPFELSAGQTCQVVVNTNGAISMPNPIQLVADAPDIAQFSSGLIIAQHLDGSLVLETSPAAPGEYIVFYVAGMGLANQTVPSGTASPSASLATALDTPTLTLNGAPVTNIPFAGLTPTLVGLYQVDFQLPANAPDGDLQLVLTQTSGLSSSTVLPVHR